MPGEEAGFVFLAGAVSPNTGVFLVACRNRGSLLFAMLQEGGQRLFDGLSPLITQGKNDTPACLFNFFLINTFNCAVMSGVTGAILQLFQVFLINFAPLGHIRQVFSRNRIK